MEPKPKFSKCVSTGTRVYYLDVYTDSKERPYLAICEIPTDRAPKGKKRQRIFVHSENIAKFADALAEACEFIKNPANE